MRKALVDSLLKYVNDPRFVFLTADLGFNMLEPLQEKLGDRFINCGIAEQNMISVCAGLAKSGMRPWCYSICPFIYARAFEQIRNDVCFHNLPVVMVGNGGGYAYGINGPTHHALEDLGVLLTLPHIKCFVPAFDQQINLMVDCLFETNHPSYLRLGIEESKHAGYAVHDAWMQIVHGYGPTILAIGPIAGSIKNAIISLPDASRPSLWVASELPIGKIPDAFINELYVSDHLIIIEEHVRQGSVGDSFINRMYDQQNPPTCFDHLYAKSMPYRAYGSQKFHRAQCGLDIDSIMELINANVARKD